MNKCNNCETVITCGCQKRKASDGTEVCTNCLVKYEGMLAAKILNSQVKES